MGATLGLAGAGMASFRQRHDSKFLTFGMTNRTGQPARFHKMMFISRKRGNR
jgi:hypothetical protein